MAFTNSAEESRRLNELVSYVFDLSRPGRLRQQVLSITNAAADHDFAQNVADCLHEVSAHAIHTVWY
jgi:hypothetical protein